MPDPQGQQGDESGPPGHEAPRSSGARGQGKEEKWQYQWGTSRLGIRNPEDAFLPSGEIYHAYKVLGCVGTAENKRADFVSFKCAEFRLVGVPSFLYSRRQAHPYFAQEYVTLALHLNWLPALLFGTNLRRLRHAKGLSQDELALEAEVSRSYLSQIEKGKFYVSLKVVGRLAEALGVAAAEFLRTPDR